MTKKTEDMTAPKHTSGPWRYCGCGKCGLVWSIPGDVVVATAEHPDTADGDAAPAMEQCIANARLIAAAPDLLEAAMAARQHMRTPLDIERAREVFAMLDLAIAKARNEAPVFTARGEP